MPRYGGKEGAAAGGASIRREGRGQREDIRLAIPFVHRHLVRRAAKEEVAWRGGLRGGRMRRMRRVCLRLRIEGGIVLLRLLLRRHWLHWLLLLSLVDGGGGSGSSGGGGGGSGGGSARSAGRRRP